MHTSATVTTDVTARHAVVTAPATASPLTATAERRHGFEPWRDVLLGLAQSVQQARSQVGVLVVEEARGQARVARTPGTPDAVNVFVDVLGQVKVDDVLDVGDVQATCGHSRCHQDRGSAALEAVQRRLALLLCAVAMDARRRVALPVQEVFQRVCTALCLDKHERQRLGARRVQQVEQEVALVALVYPYEFLRHVLRRFTNPAHRQEDVVVQEVAGEALDFFWECGAKHQRLAGAHVRHRVLLDNAADLRLETHIKHAISLVQHQEPAWMPRGKRGMDAKGKEGEGERYREEEEDEERDTQRETEIQRRRDTGPNRWVVSYSTLGVCEEVNVAIPHTTKSSKVVRSNLYAGWGGKVRGDRCARACAA